MKFLRHIPFLLSHAACIYALFCQYMTMTEFLLAMMLLQILDLPERIQSKPTEPDDGFTILSKKERKAIRKMGKNSGGAS